MRIADHSSFMLWKLSEGRKLPVGLDGKMGIDGRRGNLYQARQAFEKSELRGGVGLVVGPPLPLVFIDIDDFDPASVLQSRLIRLFSGRAYIEVSQSGDGFHILAKAEDIKGMEQLKLKQVEFYLDRRLCALSEDVGSLPLYFKSIKLEDLDLAEDCSASLRKVSKALKFLSSVKGLDVVGRLKAGLCERFSSPSEFDFDLMKAVLKHSSDVEIVQGVLMLSESDDVRRKFNKAPKTERDEYVLSSLRKLSHEWEQFIVRERFDFESWDVDNLMFKVGSPSIPLVRRKSFTVVRSLTGVGKGHFTLSGCMSLFNVDRRLSLGIGSRLVDGRLAYFDTEMGRELTARMRDMCLRKGGRDDRMLFASVKQCRIWDRLKVIGRLCGDFKPDVVVIDGLRDLVSNFNETNQVYQLIGDLEALSEELGAAVIGTIHLNPGDGFQKSRGHLGTEIEQKAFTVIHVERSEEGSQIEVSLSKTRVSKRFYPFKVEFDDIEGFLVLCDEPSIPDSAA